MAAIVVVAAAGAWAARAASPSPAALPSADSHGAAGQRAGERMKASMRVCRPGAYLEADRILGSLVVIGQKAGTIAREAQDEFDSILYTALQQAAGEVHCVAGSLTHGYERSFAQTVEEATRLARQRGLSRDVVALGEQVTIALRQNQEICAPGERPSTKADR